MPCRLSKSLTSDFVFLLFLTSFFHSSLSAETTSLNQVITDGETLVSSARAFELGFFSPDPSSNRRYLGIWFKSIPIQTVVWVANKESPLTDTTGVLSLTAGGNLILSNHIGTFWSTNTSSQKNPIVQLLDSGNLVLTEGTLIIWQSFDYPSNVFLPGMKLGWDSMTNLSRQLTSWKSPHDPSPGLYSQKLRMSGLPEILIWKKSVLWFRNGPWDGRGFGGIPLMRYDNHFAFQFVGNSHEVYFQYGIINIPLTSLAILHSTGVLEHLVWVGDQWSPYWSFPSDQCDNYAACRSYGVCHLDSKFSCECLKGFEPRLTKEWALRDWSGGCLRRVELDCGKVLESSDGFVKVSRLKLPDASNASVNGSMDFDACRNWCLKDCSCKAFAMTGGSKCVIWFGDLVDIRQFANGGEDLYVRLAASELDSRNGTSTKKNLMIIMMLIFVILSIILSGLLLWKKKRTQGILVQDWCASFCSKKLRARNSLGKLLGSVSDFLYDGISGPELEVTLFDIRTIKTATDSFSNKNVLGEGGFGLVYKGRLVDGQEMAVKRLSNDSVQGLDEFKNEVVLIAKLQHRNLVQLLGCCIEGYERMLIYEYMPNRSLDALIFDKAKGALLDWQKRIDIIVGIARGLLYLHQDSRFNIIHRDLKASNILLDKEMNPKISDFGIARIFGGGRKQEHTKRVVGTYGYMSPEYAMGGVYSVKSDVFSFGVIVLEILSGKKNRVVYEAEPRMNLVGHAWRLWREDKSLELLDESLDVPCPESEILRCIQVGLLCVQEGRDDRPAMSSVVLMLGSKTAELPQPKRPGFCMRTVMGSTPIYADQSLHATNEVTITRLEGR